MFPTLPARMSFSLEQVQRLLPAITGGHSCGKALFIPIPQAHCFLLSSSYCFTPEASHRISHQLKPKEEINQCTRPFLPHKADTARRYSLLKWWNAVASEPKYSPSPVEDKHTHTKDYVRNIHFTVVQNYFILGYTSQLDISSISYERMDSNRQWYSNYFLNVLLR